MDIHIPRPRLGAGSLTHRVRYMAIAGLTIASVSLIACSDDKTATPTAVSSPTVTATSATATPTSTATATATGSATATPTGTAVMVTGPSAVTADDQTSDGTSIMVASATLPVPGFVAIHSDANGSPGPVIGVSDLLPAGDSTDIAIVLDQNLEADATVYPMVHVDANGNGVYEFPGVDVPGTTAANEVAVVAIAVTVETAGTPTETATATGGASIQAEDQTGDGTSIVVASVTLPDGGFVAIHSDENGAPGPVIGASELLPPGTSEDVVVMLDTPLEADATVYPMGHVDANANGIYEFPGPDGPAIDDDGAVVVVPLLVTVQAGSEGAAIEAADQSGDGTTVTVATITLPDGGFVAIHADENGAPGAVIGVSDLLPAGSSTDVVITLDEPLTANAIVYPMGHVDGNGNGTYEFPGADGPATDVNGNVVVVPLNYTVEG